MSEHDEQVALFQWAAWLTPQYPELDLLFAIPNGGHRHPAVAARLQAEGVRPGVLDTCLPVARHGRHGLFIELKYGRKRPSEHQLTWLKRLTEQGYLAVVCYGWQEAAQVIKDYLEIVEGEA